MPRAIGILLRRPQRGLKRSLIAQLGQPVADHGGLDKLRTSSHSVYQEWFESDHVSADYSPGIAIRLGVIAVVTPIIMIDKRISRSEIVGRGPATARVGASGQPVALR